MNRRTIPASGRVASPRLVVRPGTRRATDAPAVRPQLALLAIGVLGLLLLEVWQTATVASLSVRLGHSVHALQQATAERAWLSSRLEQGTSRSELGPVAASLGLKPVDPRRIVTLPEEYLEPAPGGAASAPTAPLLAMADRALEALVPDAAARGRNVN